MVSLQLFCWLNNVELVLLIIPVYDEFEWSLINQWRCDVDYFLVTVVYLLDFMVFPVFFFRRWEFSWRYCIFFSDLHNFSLCHLLLQFRHSADFAWQMCCLDQFGAPHCPHRISLYFVLRLSGFFLGLSWLAFLDHFRLFCRSGTCWISMRSFELFESFSRSFIYLWISSVIVSMVMLLFHRFVFNS